MVGSEVYVDLFAIFVSIRKRFHVKPNMVAGQVDSLFFAGGLACYFSESNHFAVFLCMVTCLVRSYLL